VLAAAPYRQLDLRRAWHIALCNLPVLPEVAFRVAPRPLATAALRAQTRRQSVLDAAGERVAGEAVGADPAGWLQYYRTLSRRAVGEWVLRRVRRRVSLLRDPASPNQLRVPVHVVWGEADPVFPLAIAERVAHDLAADLEVLPGAGHHLPIEAPTGLTKAVLRFAAEHRLRDQTAGVA
jgi:pimeloyl-ACP methyl ester carboxylesterase